VGAVEQRPVLRGVSRRLGRGVARDREVDVLAACGRDACEEQGREGVRSGAHQSTSTERRKPRSNESGGSSRSDVPPSA
jgi:hypothetical protein